MKTKPDKDLLAYAKEFRSIFPKINGKPVFTMGANRYVSEATLAKVADKLPDDSDPNIYDRWDLVAESLAYDGCE